MPAVVTPLLLMMQAATTPAVPDTLPRQALPTAGCAAYLWTGEAERRLVAMATAGAGRGSLRVSLSGRVLDLSRVAGPDVAAPFGLGGAAEYRSADASARLDLDVATRGDLTGGAVVPAGTLTLARGTGDALVLPVVGLVGCASEAR